MTVQFTGEYFVPERSGERIEADHMARYQFAKAYASGKPVLDIACGIGYAAPILREAGAMSYKGVDIKQELVDYAASHYAGANISFEVGNICDFVDANRYDLIVCFETIEHVANYRQALNNLYSLLNDNGVLLISSPNRIITTPWATSLQDKPANRFHTQEFIPGELIAELRAAGFVVDDADIFGQRQRIFFRNRYLRRLARLFSGDPDTKTSPAVEPVRNKTPKYFVVKASRKGAGS